MREWALLEHGRRWQIPLRGQSHFSAEATTHSSGATAPPAGSAPSLEGQAALGALLPSSAAAWGCSPGSAQHSWRPGWVGPGKQRPWLPSWPGPAQQALPRSREVWESLFPSQLRGARKRNGSGAQGSAPGGTGGPDPAPRAARPAVTPPPPRGQQGWGEAKTPVPGGSYLPTPLRSSVRLDETPR